MDIMQEKLEMIREENASLKGIYLLLIYLEMIHSMQQGKAQELNAYKSILAQTREMIV